MVMKLKELVMRSKEIFIQARTTFIECAWSKASIIFFSFQFIFLRYGDTLIKLNNHQLKL